MVMQCSPRYPQDMPWYPFIDIYDCPRFSTCKNCNLKSCPVVENAKSRLRHNPQLPCQNCDNDRESGQSHIHDSKVNETALHESHYNGLEEIKTNREIFSEITKEVLNDPSLRDKKDRRIKQLRNPQKDRSKIIVVSNEQTIQDQDKGGRGNGD